MTNEDLETQNRIAALMVAYRENRPDLVREVRRRQKIELQREAVAKHDYQLADDLDNERRP